MSPKAKYPKYPQGIANTTKMSIMTIVVILKNYLGLSFSAYKFKIYWLPSNKFIIAAQKQGILDGTQ